MEYLSHAVAVCGFLLFSTSAESAMELQYSIQEDLLPGTFVANIFADSHIEQERGMSNLAGLRFRFLSHPDLDFTIEDRTGIIRIGSQIDRDLICPQQPECLTMLDVVAVITGSMKFFRIFKVVIEIVDLNDNSPKFPQSEISYHILESTLPGSNFMIPTAVDPDSGVNGIKGYHLVPDDEAFALQVLENLDGSTDLRLILNTRLDRERQASYQVKVIAFDGGEPPRSGTVDVLIAVQDANDNSPRFQNSSYAVNIPENIPIQSIILTVHAQDYDAGLYGQVIYSFSARTEGLYGDLFGVRNTTGELYVKSVIDYEKGSVYHLSIIAKDRGPDSLPADTTVIVKVQDINDHSPAITVNTLAATGTDEAEVAEDADVGTFVAHLTVVDRDSGLNGNFSCHLNDNHFQLEGMYPGEFQVTTAQTLDREERSQYSLAIMCQDRGSEPQISIKHIKILVTDANDNAPEFTQDGYSSKLAENNYMGASVIQVNATDPDSGKNAQLWYRLDTDAGDSFTIDPLSGQVTARAVFDHEKTALVQFHVLAIDHGDPSLTGTVAVMVHIEDVNDERPTFSQDAYSFSVDENQPSGTQVGIVAATDPDSSVYSSFTYSLIPHYSTVNTFAVHSQSGVITTKVPLDRESQAVYRFTVVVKDSGIPPLSSSCPVTVHVTDQNDNDPIFDFPSRHNNSIYISNMVPRGFVVTRVSAHDLDIGSNGNLSFSLTAGDEESMFHMDPMSGIVSVARALANLDYEIFELVVTAQDHGNPQRSVMAGFNIVVNKSVHYPYDKESVLVGHSMAIVISIAVVSGALMVILVLAIVALRRKDRRHSKDQKYNCRMEALKMIHAQEASGDGSLPSSPNKPPLCLASEQDKTKAALDNDYNQLHLNHNSVQVHQLLDMIKQDQDADSAYSGESSNTDSGHGHSEEGDGTLRALHDPHNAGLGRGHRVHPGHPDNSFGNDCVASGNPSFGQPGLQTFGHKPVVGRASSYRGHEVEPLYASGRKPGFHKPGALPGNMDSPHSVKGHNNPGHYGNQSGYHGHKHGKYGHGSSRNPYSVPNISQTIPEESPYGYYQGNTFYVQGTSKKDTVV